MRRQEHTGVCDKGPQERVDGTPVTCWKKGIMIAMVSSGLYAGRMMFRQGCLTARAYCTLRSAMSVPPADALVARQRRHATRRCSALP